ncbi:salicylate hydroxylase [Nemania abortiva]|nr:salicylate hydroxylase [Nemania abortiva]
MSVSRLASYTHMLTLEETSLGLAGSALANALKQIPHIRIRVYEATATFSERGAAIFPPGGKDDLLKIAGAGSGPHARKIIFDSAGTEPEMIVHRASLLRELLALLPQDILYADKKLVSISSVPNTHRVRATFVGGAADEFDGVIGADGIFSLVCSYVRQGGVDKHAATPAGFRGCRSLVSMDKAKAVLGTDLFEIDRQCGRVGDGGFMMHDMLENRTVVQCVIPVAFRNWLDGPLVGDAAHTMTPWQGSGAAVAFEDVMILQELFRHVRSPVQIEPVFKAYDALRRPRCQRVADSSRETGMILCGQNEEADLDLEKLGLLLSTMWDFIAGLDMIVRKNDAVIKLNEYIEALGSAIA